MSSGKWIRVVSDIVVPIAASVIAVSASWGAIYIKTILPNQELVRSLGHEVKATSQEVKATSQEVKATSQEVKATSQEVKATSIGSLENGQKICSVFSTDPVHKWRDSLVVPKTWTIENCLAYKNAVKAGRMQLGCAFAKELSFPNNIYGGEERETPPSNCGW